MVKKIPTLFVRDMSKQPALVIEQVNPGCEWVLRGEGVPTRKWDGTCCLVRDGKLYKRREMRVNTALIYMEDAPQGWEQVDVDKTTLKAVGWVPVGDGPDDKWHWEAWNRLLVSWGGMPSADVNGTFELIGPKIQGNPEQASGHVLIRHGEEVIPVTFRDFDGIREYLRTHDIEGIVWHHPDGRMAKIKGKDFGLKRKKS